MVKSKQQKQRDGQTGGGRGIFPKFFELIIAFLIGCVASGTIILHFLASSGSYTNINVDPHTTIGGRGGIVSKNNNDNNNNIITIPDNQRELINNDNNIMISSTSQQQQQQQQQPLQDLRILIAIAAFDFSQLPHLEEVIDTYQDLCVSGPKKVDIVIHSTVPYPITLIDLFNNRLVPSCYDIFSIKIILKPPYVRLHLVDFHRPLFYEQIDNYDLFIYTEDDIRVSPKTISAYMSETNKVKELVGSTKASDYNVGIVRYEYNYPSNVIIDDKTRHATQNVTRVYWEHGQFPTIPKSVEGVTRDDISNKIDGYSYIHMKNHHQGMFLATQELLKAWKIRNGCDFHKVRDRPGRKDRPSQPTEGTQRVWMSSQMLYGGRHCNVQQVIPVNSFGTFTVLHLPNKNYRRVGHFRNRTFSDGTEQFDYGGPTGSLLTAMQLHLSLITKFPPKPQIPYKGIQMIDDVGRRGRTPLLERRMKEFHSYASRGGILSDDDKMKTALVEYQ